MTPLQQLHADIRAVRSEMKAKRIKRISCFNGGHSAESYRLNSRMFELESRKKALRIK